MFLKRPCSIYGACFEIALVRFDLKQHPRLIMLLFEKMIKISAEMLQQLTSKRRKLNHPERRVFKVQTVAGSHVLV